MVSKTEVEREIFREVGETCPDIDKAIKEMESVIKDKTNSFREALRKYTMYFFEEQEKTKELEEQINELEEKINELEEKINELENKVNELEA